MMHCSRRTRIGALSPIPCTDLAAHGPSSFCTDLTVQAPCPLYQITNCENMCNMVVCRNICMCNTHENVVPSSTRVEMNWTWMQSFPVETVTLEVCSKVNLIQSKLIRLGNHNQHQKKRYRIDSRVGLVTWFLIYHMRCNVLYIMLAWEFEHKEKKDIKLLC